MGGMSVEEAGSFDVQSSLAEFADLNRRRLFGSPSLAVGEMERWLELKTRLEAHFGDSTCETWGGLERREFLRLPIHIRIELGEGSDFQLATVRDVSQGGMFIATRRPLAKGSLVSVDLRADPEDEAVELTGTVAWISHEREGTRPPGMGLSFPRLDAKQRAVVSKLVQRAASDCGEGA